MATHSSILAWRIPQTEGTWWTIVHRVARSQTQLKRLSMRVDTMQDVFTHVKQDYVLIK